MPDSRDSTGEGVDEPAYLLDGSSATYRSLVNALPMSLLIKDLAGRRVFANDTYLTFRQFTFDQIAGKRDVDLFPPDIAATYQRDDEYVIRTGESLRATERTLDSTGKVCWIERIKSPVVSAAGKVIGVQLVFWDVTESVLAAEQQAQDRHLLNTLLKNIPDSIYFKDTDSRFIRLSDAMAAKFGMSGEQQVVGKTDADIFTEEHAAAARADELRVIETGEPLVDRLEKETWPDRENTWCMSTKMAFRDASGNVIGTFGISRDVTELKRSQDALVEARDAADKANRAKSDFLANMSHEIRTPMNAIIGMSELLSQTKLTPEQSDYVGLVRESADSLLRLLNDILDFSKIEARKLELEIIPFSLRDVVGKTGRTLSLRSAEKGLELTCRVAPEIPDRLLGDPGRLRQVLMNLIGNAIKFTEAGEVTVNVALADPVSSSKTRLPSAEPAAESLRLRFSVRDTGVGIPPDKQAAVLEAFTQADTSTTRRYGGTGLGLAISKQLVELMDGELMLESELNVGTTFWFDAQFGIAADQRSTGREQLKSLTGLPVLVVDDNATNRRIMEEIFTAWRLQPTVASDAAMALQCYQQANASEHPFRLVILDCMMPEMDGFQLATEIRRLDLAHETIMIMLSSAQRSDDSLRCQQLGIARFMNKPVVQSELLDLVLDVMEVSNRGTEPASAQLEDQIAPLRILVAEDGLANQHVAMGMLQLAGHEAVIAVDGREAVQKWQSEAFDMILMDMHMPVMDGIEATRIIRRSEQDTGEHIPIIAVTAAAMQDDASACHQAGMDGYLTKPISPAQLRDVIARHAPRSRKSQELGAPPPLDPGADARQVDSSCSVEQAAVAEQAEIADCDIADLQATAQRLPGGQEGLKKLVAVFLGECQLLMQSLERALSEGHVEEARLAAHTLKGSANLFAAKRVCDAARSIERHAERQEIDRAQQAFSTLECEVAELVRHLKAASILED